MSETAPGSDTTARPASRFKASARAASVSKHRPPPASVTVRSGKRRNSSGTAPRSSSAAREQSGSSRLANRTLCGGGGVAGGENRCVSIPFGITRMISAGAAPVRITPVRKSSLTAMTAAAFRHIRPVSGPNRAAWTVTSRAPRTRKRESSTPMVRVCAWRMSGCIFLTVRRRRQSRRSNRRGFLPGAGTRSCRIPAASRRSAIRPPAERTVTSCPSARNPIASASRCVSAPPLSSLSVNSRIFIPSVCPGVAGFILFDAMAECLP